MNRSEAMDFADVDHRSAKGSVAVEAALAFLVLIPIVLGIAEYGLFFYTSHRAEYAAFEGARAGAISQGDKEEDAVKEAEGVVLQLGLAKYHPNIRADATIPSAVPNKTLTQVTIEFGYTPLTFIPVPATIRAVASQINY